MHYPEILCAIDAELNKLLQVRNILASIVESVPLTHRDRLKKRMAKKTSSEPPQAARPMESTALSSSIDLIPMTSAGAVCIPTLKVTVLPPRQKREYRRTIKPFVPEPRALAAPRSSEVVVYMAPSTPQKTDAIVPAGPSASSENLEAVMRQKLLGTTRSEWSSKREHTVSDNLSAFGSGAFPSRETTVQP